VLSFSFSPVRQGTVLNKTGDNKTGDGSLSESKETETKRQMGDGAVLSPKGDLYEN